MLEINKIYNMDCLKGHKLIDRSSVDLICIDPPYGELPIKWDDFGNWRELKIEYDRILKDSGQLYIFGKQPMLSEILFEFKDIFSFRFEIVWNKKRGLWFSEFEPTRSHELIWCFKKKGVKSSDLCFNISEVMIKGEPYSRKNKSMHTKVRNKWEVRSYDCKDGLRYPKSILTHSCIGGNSKNNFHPTQKPQMLLEWIVKSSSRKGDLVLDSFMGCYDEQTEILTNSGWKFFKYLTFDDEVATLDKNHVMYYTKPLDIQKYYYEGEMIKVNHRSIDLLITPNHSLYLREQHRDKYEFIRVKDLKYYAVHFINSINWNMKDNEFFGLEKIDKGVKETSNYEIEKFDTSIFLKFLGWYISDGSITNDGKYDIKIHQTKKKNFREIKECIEELGYNCNYYNRRFNFNNKQLWKYLRKLGKSYEKYIPEEFLQLSKRQLKILFDALIKGDGHINKNGQTIYYTTSKKLADQFQELCLKIGYNSTLSSRFRETNGEIKGRKINSMRKCYEINVRKSKECRLTLKKHFHRKNYKGMVYCCTVPDNILCVRRNGRVVWCGNSGTTAIVCKKLNRKFIGFDISKEYCDIAKKRLKDPNLLKMLVYNKANEKRLF